MQQPSQAETDSAFVTLVENYKSDTTGHIAAPGRVLPGIDTPELPAGYALRTRRITHPDGTVEEIREPVTLPVEDTATRPRFSGYADLSYATATQQPASHPQNHRLPDWVTTNTAKRKAAIAVIGIGTATIIYSLYGDAIATSVSHGLHQAWAFATHAMAVAATVALIGAGLYFLLRPKGGSRQPRGGWFEGKISGRWGED